MPLHGRFIGIGIGDVSTRAPVPTMVAANLPSLCATIEEAIRALGDPSS